MILVLPKELLFVLVLLLACSCRKASGRKGTEVQDPKLLNNILGMTAPQTVAAAVSLDEVAPPKEPAAAVNPHIPQEPVTAEQVSEDTEEDTMSYFARLANAD